MTTVLDHLHSEFDLNEGDTVEVTLDHAANVQLLDSANYLKYKNGEEFTYYGGYVRKSPYRLPTPRAGHWHLVIDLGGGPGMVRASVKIIPSASA